MTPHEESPLWRLKVRLQFTGWLQYVPTAVAALAFLLVAAIGRWIGVLPVLLFWLPAAIGTGLLGILVLDLVTVKAGLAPPEPMPRPKTGLDEFDLMRARFSVRSYQRRDLTAEHRAELMESVRAETRPEGLLGDKPIRFEYVAAALTVWPVVGGHEFLVAIAPREYDRLAVIDVGRSLQKVVLHATRMGLGTCWIGPGADQKSIAQHLGDRFDPEKDHVICVCAVGYRSWFEPLMLRLMPLNTHRRLPLADLFFASPRCDAPLDVRTPPFADFGRCYEVCRWSPSSYNSQTTRCAAVVDDGRLVRFDFLASTTSHYYAPVALGIWCADWELGCGALGIPGHFEVLTSEERGEHGAPELPRYDISWVLDRAESVPRTASLSNQGTRKQGDHLRAI